MRKIIVTVEGGVVQGVDALGLGEPVEVEVRDYDIGDEVDAADGSMKQDEKGERYYLNVFKL